MALLTATGSSIAPRGWDTVGARCRSGRSTAAAAWQAARRSAPSLPDRDSDPVLELQRSAGNAAVAAMLARAPAAKGTTGSVQIGGVGEIKVSGGNLEEWPAKGAPDAVEVVSEKGKHSAKLEKLATAGTKPMSR